MKLQKLVCTMAKPSTPFDAKPTHDPIPAGYTYFGQFIDHDLTFDDTDSPTASDVGTTVDPLCVTNHRKEFLNLQCLYGDGPESDTAKSLYEEDGASFRLGAALPNGQAFDVPLDDECKPQTADRRNVENVIVRQIHAIFLRLHNVAVEEALREDPNLSKDPPVLFRKARKRVCHQYQWLVRNDFLVNICDKATTDALRSGPTRFIDWGSNTFSIPVEFAQAAFRFGHSIVKSKYRLRGRPKAELRDLFGSAKRPGALSAAFAVNWNEFLGKAGGKSQFANLIDTTLVSDLFNVPEDSTAMFVAGAKLKGDPTERILPLRTLRRGAASRLCSGEVAMKRACPDGGLVPPVMCDKNAEERQPGCYDDDPLRHLSEFNGESPLWYYILLEAQLNESGTRLGSLGSRIVAGTIEGALLANPGSIVHELCGQEPKPWCAPDKSEIPVRSLYDLVRVVGLI